MNVLNSNEAKRFNIRIDDRSEVVRHLLVRHFQGDPVDESITNDRCVLIANLPPFVDEKCVRRFFGEFGSVSKAIFSDDLNFSVGHKRRSKFFDKHIGESPSFAVVVFDDKKSVENVFKCDSEEIRSLYTREEKPKTGIVKWQQDYNDSIIDIDSLKTEIEEYMRIYDEKVEREAQEAKAKEGVPDEEGWITVTRHGKRSFNANSEYLDNLILSKKRKSDKVLTNFYNFQRTQAKMDNLSSLREKFEEDKKRIALMKATRKFKPLS